MISEINMITGLGETKMMNSVIETQQELQYTLIRYILKSLVFFIKRSFFFFNIICNRLLGIHLIEKIDGYISN